MNPLIFLAPLFFMISFLYSLVGLGGGSAYIAALALSGVSYTFIPTIALSLNIVVSGSSWLRYFEAGYFKPKILFPLVLSSIPTAFIGGLLPLSEKSFYLLLVWILLLSAVWIFLAKEIRPSKKPIPHYKRFLIAFSLGTILGFISGSVGIGGGIFLGPVLLLFGWTNPKQTAALTSAFVFLNSVSGSLAHLSKQFPDLSIWLPLLGVVLLGGQLGSVTGANIFSTKLLQKSLGVVLFVTSLVIGLKIL